MAIEFLPMKENDAWIVCKLCNGAKHRISSGVESNVPRYLCRDEWKPMKIGDEVEMEIWEPS